MASKVFLTICVLLAASLLIPQAFSIDESEASSDGSDHDAITELEIDIDGWPVDPNLDEIAEEKEEKEQRGPSTRHPFERVCPYGYFKCNNDECIALRWRCDGHYDCDDFSDETNCTSLDIPHHSSIIYVAPARANATQVAASSSSSSSPSTSPSSVQMHGLEFNSSVEPLMVFSTGSSIRGLWMKARIYFDIATRNKAHSISSVQPSITDAFSLFFGIFQSEAQRAGPSSARPISKADEPPKRRTTIVGLDMDPTNREVYWVELGKEPGVYSAPIEENIFEARHRRQAHTFKKVVDFNLLAPEDIALDLIGRNAYITDAGIPAVVVCSYVNGHCKQLVTTNIHKPRAIIADSATGWITFTDWGDRPGIYLVSMDGRRLETLIESDVVWPNGLAADPSTNSLYWADARLNKIERVDLKTRQRHIVIKEVNTNPFSVSLFENRIYWSDWSKNEIKTVDKFSGNGSQTVIRADDIYGIHIYHPDLYQSELPVVNPCWSKRCTHMCLLSPGSSSYSERSSSSLKATCACPESMTLSHTDKATCYKHTQRKHEVHHATVPQAKPSAALNTRLQSTPAPSAGSNPGPQHHEEQHQPQQHHSSGEEMQQHSNSQKYHEIGLLPYPDMHHEEAQTVQPHVKMHYLQTSSPLLVNHEPARTAEMSAEQQPEGNKMVWLIVFLLILSATGLVTVLSLLLLHKQGRLPRQVSVSFISPNANQDKDRAMLLLDTDS